MSARLVFIGLLSIMGVVFSLIILGMYIYMKRTTSSGKSLMEEAVNEQKNTEKMGLGEFLIYGSFIVIAVLYVIQMMNRESGGSPILAKAILLPPVMALFNARKRTGRTIFVFMATAIIAFYMSMVYIIIGLPPKAPVLTINSTQITMAHTSLGDITKDGFDIYVRQKESSNMDYNKLLTSGDYKKYPLDRSISLKKGFQRYNDTVYRAPYLLVKDGLVVGNIGFYGDKDRETVIEDCKIVYLRLEKAYIDAARANSISYKLDGVDLLGKLKLESLQKNFGDKLWLLPPSKPIDESQLHYGIQWTSGSDHLFWNQYFSYIHFDESNMMTSFDLSTEIGRDDHKK